MWEFRCSTLNMKERRMWSLPSRSLRVARSVASRESGSTLDIFTFHSYNESFTSSTWNHQPIRSWMKCRQFFFYQFVPQFTWVYWPGRHQIWNWDSYRCLAALSSVYLWPANVSSETIFAAELEVPAHCQRRCLSCNLDAGLPSVAPIPEKNFWTLYYKRPTLYGWLCHVKSYHFSRNNLVTWRCSVPRSSSCLAFFDTASTSLK